MKRHTTLALCGALACLVAALVVASTAFAGSGSPTTVTVRVEGLSKELLAPTKVTTKTGSIRKGGTPAGKCPSTSAAGALDVATHHNWNGTYTKYGLEVLSILGESHPFTSKDYWEIFVNDVPASAGACELALHHGDKVLFAAVPDSGTEYPLGLVLPSQAVAGKAFKAKVVYYNAKGKAKALAGATVSIGHDSAKTGSNGTISLKGSAAGTFTVTATDKGYIRSGPVTIKVKPA